MGADRLMAKPSPAYIGERFCERYETYSQGEADADMVACAQLAVGHLVGAGLHGGAAALAVLLDKEFPDNGSPWEGRK